MVRFYSIFCPIVYHCKPLGKHCQKYGVILLGHAVGEQLPVLLRQVKYRQQQAARQPLRRFVEQALVYLCFTVVHIDGDNFTRDIVIIQTQRKGCPDQKLGRLFLVFPRLWL